ncbi:MAG: hypothetical protein ACE5I3_04910 [Phycisphaerae bacterium]
MEVKKSDGLSPAPTEAGGARTGPRILWTGRRIVHAAIQPVDLSAGAC